MLQNVQCLKWCSQYGIRVEWNLLYGFPGETPGDYADTLRVLEAIAHLRPPYGVFPIRIDRFSPNFFRRDELGFVNVRPAAGYAYLYPLGGRDLFDLSYHFDHDYADGRDPSTYVRPVKEFVARWKKSTRGHLVHVAIPGGGAIIDDTRYGRDPSVIELTPDENSVYVACDEARTVAQLERGLPRLGGPTIRETLRRFLGQQLVLSEGERFLSLAPVATAQEGAREFDRATRWLAVVG
jgi:hypothetical protein